MPELSRPARPAVLATVSPRTPSVPLSLFLALCLASTALANEWQTIRECRLIENEGSQWGQILTFDISRADAW
ncbi:MAG: hypothetical protein JHC85_06495 [Chthoniobacterales bacterium]|nr:hypothetical protein [Chthoniobacterales bacterium]